MTSEELQSIIRAGLPCEHISLEGDGRHWFATIVSAEFEGKRPDPAPSAGVRDAGCENAHRRSACAFDEDLHAGRMGRAKKHLVSCWITHGQASHSRRAHASRRSTDFRREERRLARAVRRTADRATRHAAQRAAAARRHDHAQVGAQHGRGCAAKRRRHGRAWTQARFTRPRRLTNWSRPCAHRCWRSGPCWRVSASARVSLPGGCAIGSRPVDQHIKGLQAMGAEIVVEHGYMVAGLAGGRKRLHGARITTDMVTVTGTENFLMAAALAEGETVLENAAQEPEITDLAEMLIEMGAKIEGQGTSRIRVQGRRAPARLHAPGGGRPDRGRHLSVRRGGCWWRRRAAGMVAPTTSKR